MAEVAAGVITGHSTADLSWKCETKYRGRKTARGRIGNTENQKMGQDISGDGHRHLRLTFILLQLMDIFFIAQRGRKALRHVF